MSILGLIGTAAAVAMLVLPTPVFASCSCFPGAPVSGQAAVASPHSHSCCGEDESAANAGKTQGDPQERHDPSHCPQNCPHDCKSPCCSVQPTVENPWCMAADFFRSAPAGLISVPSSQLPSSPTLDGLLRPPID
jgi:hypothetical protein